MNLVPSVSVALAALASAASAVDFGALSGPYGGGGTWTSSDGRRGRWTTAVAVTTDAEGTAVEESLKVYAPGVEPDRGVAPSHEETGRWRMRATGNGFFDVMVGDRKIGWGVCHDESCQLTGRKTEGSDYAETWVVGPKSIFRTGYDRAADVTVSWSGAMQRKND